MASPGTTRKPMPGTAATSPVNVAAWSAPSSHRAIRPVGLMFIVRGRPRLMRAKPGQKRPNASAPKPDINNCNVFATRPQVLANKYKAASAAPPPMCIAAALARQRCFSVGSARKTAPNHCPQVAGRPQRPSPGRRSSPTAGCLRPPQQAAEPARNAAGPQEAHHTRPSGTG